MAKLDLLIAAWDEGHREFSIALDGLPDEDVWKRPHPRLLSVGELAGHIAFWDAVKTTVPQQENDPALDAVPIKSVLLDPAFKYYETSVDIPVDLGLGTAELLTEVRRIQLAAKAFILQAELDSEDLLPGSAKTTWGQSLQYRGFHVAYHTGQIYSVRHLLGHHTTDN